MTTQSIQFTCEAHLQLTPLEVAQQILDLGNWTDFQGYGLLPGIKSATFDIRTPEIVGSRIRVENTDGSGHVEEIISWDPDRCLKLKLHEFSKPLSSLATEFHETWNFHHTSHDTKVAREFVLYPKASWTRPLLWLISIFLKKAIDRHLRQLN